MSKKKVGSGRTKGATSCSLAKLEDLNKRFRPGQLIPVNRRWAISNNLPNQPMESTTERIHAFSNEVDVQTINLSKPAPATEEAPKKESVSLGSIDSAD